MNTNYAIIILFFFPLLLIQWIPSDNQSEQNFKHETCRALADLRVEDTNLLSAAVVPAGDDLPEYCRVLGYVRPAINFEIRLPTSDWNGKFYMSGCGGFCGKLSSDSDFVTDIKGPLQRRYAVSMTDGGHWSESIFDGRWAYHNRQAEIDFGYRAVHETARVTKSIIEAFYEQQPAFSYFGGCSNGGRQGVMQALRYPEDFDGIISFDPALNLGKGLLKGPWLARVNSGPDGSDLIAATEARLLEEAVYDACDSLDGLDDGLISDPRLCDFDPAALLCEEGRAEGCLTQAQVDAARALYQGPRDSAGRQLYPGLIYGSEPYWPFWISGPMLTAPLEYFRYMGFREDPGERFTLEDFDFDNDPPRLEFMGSIYSADNPDLEAFRERDGKLLMVQSWADPAVNPTTTINYYEAAEELVGSREKTQDFFRLIMLPGADHCGLGEGPGIRNNGFDPLTALERWVEEGEGPESLLTTKTDEEGNVLWTRPACPWPQREMYAGQGDANDASSFACVDP